VADPTRCLWTIKSCLFGLSPAVRHRRAPAREEADNRARLQPWFAFL